MELQEFLDEIQRMSVPSPVHHASTELTESEKRKFGPFIAALNALIDNFNHLRSLAGEVEAPKISEEDYVMAKVRGGPGVVVHNTASGTTIGLKEKPPEPRPFLPYIFLREGAYHLATDGANHGDPRTRLTGMIHSDYYPPDVTFGHVAIEVSHRNRWTLVDGREAKEDAEEKLVVRGYAVPGTANVTIGCAQYPVTFSGNWVVYFIVSGTTAENP